MAIVVEGTYTSTSVKTSISFINSIPVPVESNMALYVFLSHHQKTASGGKYAFGLTYTMSGELPQLLDLIGREEYNEEVVEIWRLLAPISHISNSGSVEIEWVDNNANWDGSCHAAVVMSGVDQGTPNDGFLGSSGTGAGATRIFLNPEQTQDGDLCYGVFSVDNVDPTEAGDGTSQWNLNNDMSYGDGVSVVADGEISMLYTIGGGADWASAGISINPFVEAGPFNVLEGKLINRKINPYINERIN